MLRAGIRIDYSGSSNSQAKLLLNPCTEESIENSLREVEVDLNLCDDGDDGNDDDDGNGNGNGNDNNHYGKYEYQSKSRSSSSSSSETEDVGYCWSDKNDQNPESLGGDSNRSVNSCVICLENFRSGDTVVAGRKDCCKSSKFHKQCIRQWLRINDSCPCCRQPMLEQAEAVPESDQDADANANTNTHALYFRSQFRNRIDTATRLRNEVLTYFVEQSQSDGITIEDYGI